MSNLQSAIQLLYEDISLREELTDDEAKVLLQWAEGKVVELDDATPDEETFDKQFKQLRRMMKRMNKFIGYRTSSGVEEQQKLVEKFLDSAVDLGIKVDQSQIQPFLVAQQQQSNAAVLQSMLGMLQTEYQNDDGTSETQHNRDNSQREDTKPNSNLLGSLGGALGTSLGGDDNNE